MDVNGYAELELPGVSHKYRFFRKAANGSPFQSAYILKEKIRLYMRVPHFDFAPIDRFSPVSI
jgi:hypothetical protein